MARKKKDIPPRKEHFIGFRLTYDLYEAISKEAEQAKMSVSEYCRHLATDHKITVHREIVFDSRELLKELGDMGKIGSNLNQIAHHLNEGLPMYEDLKKEIYRCITDIKEIRDNIRKVTGEYRGDNKTRSD